jgi:hypothetical protein
MPTSQRLSPAKQATIDAYGECDRQLKLWKPQGNPHKPEHDRLEAEILGWETDLAADKSDVLLGKLYEVKVSERGFQRTFTEVAQGLAFGLFQKIEGLPLTQFLSITLADAKRLLGQPWLDVHAPRLQTGPRAVTVVPRAEAAAVATRKAA